MFSDIREKLNKRYYNDFNNVYKDFQLVFENAKKYNDKNTYVFNMSLNGKISDKEEKEF